jgi:hypothetical protein
LAATPRAYARASTASRSHIDVDRFAVARNEDYGGLRAADLK